MSIRASRDKFCCLAKAVMLVPLCKVPSGARKAKELTWGGGLFPALFCAAARFFLWVSVKGSFFTPISDLLIFLLDCHLEHQFHLVFVVIQLVVFCLF